MPSQATSTRLCTRQNSANRTAKTGTAATVINANSLMAHKNSHMKPQFTRKKRTARPSLHLASAPTECAASSNTSIGTSTRSSVTLRSPTWSPTRVYSPSARTNPNLLAPLTLEWRDCPYLTSSTLSLKMRKLKPSISNYLTLPSVTKSMAKKLAPRIVPPGQLATPKSCSKPVYSLSWIDFLRQD